MLCSLSGRNFLKKNSMLIAYEKFSHDRNNLFFFFMCWYANAIGALTNESSIDLTLTFNNMLCTMRLWMSFIQIATGLFVFGWQVVHRTWPHIWNYADFQVKSSWAYGRWEEAAEAHLKQKCQNWQWLHVENASNCVHSFDVWSVDECCIQSEMDVFTCACVCVCMHRNAKIALTRRCRLYTNETTSLLWHCQTITIFCILNHKHFTKTIIFKSRQIHGNLNGNKSYPCHNSSVFFYFSALGDSLVVGTFECCIVGFFISWLLLLLFLLCQLWICESFFVRFLSLSLLSSLLFIFFVYRILLRVAICSLSVCGCIISRAVILYYVNMQRMTKWTTTINDSRMESPALNYIMIFVISVSLHTHTQREREREETDRVGERERGMERQECAQNVLCFGVKREKHMLLLWWEEIISTYSMEKLTFQPSQRDTLNSV